MTTTTETLTHTKTTYSDGFWEIEYRNADNKLHRTGGPAYENSSGASFYYLNNKRHRLDGPALIYSDGSVSWYLYDKRLTEDEHAERVAAMNSEIDETLKIEEVTIDGKRYRVFLEEITD